MASTSDLLQLLKVPRYTLWADREGKRRRVTFPNTYSRQRAEEILVGLGFTNIKDEK